MGRIEAQKHQCNRTGTFLPVPGNDMRPPDRDANISDAPDQGKIMPETFSDVINYIGYHLNMSPAVYVGSRISRTVCRLQRKNKSTPK